MINNKSNVVPDNKILIVPENETHNDDYKEIIQPLKGCKTRDWINQHVIHCLPVVIGNQYGFAIKSNMDFTAIWNGDPAPNDVSVSIPEPSTKQFVSAHFGSGLITVQNRFTFRTPPGINLMVLDPPNFFIPNLSNMFAVVETDNLRRDFTFNLKITQPNVPVKVNKGDIISAIIPIPRYFVDNFEIDLAENYFSEEVIKEERKEMNRSAIERGGPDRQKPHGVGKRYWKGEDCQGNKFKDHQRKL